MFGASKHQYLSTPVSPSDIAQFEADLGTALPPEYTAFLQRVGHGAGPYYGVWSPRESLAELRGHAQDDEREAGNPLGPALPFLFQYPILRGIDAQANAGVRPAVAWQDWPCSGCVPICHQDWAVWSLLVLKGDFAGRVWDVANFEGDSGGWTPAQRPAGTQYGRTVTEPLPRPPTFNEWFSGWLEQCESDLTTAAKARPPR